MARIFTRKGVRNFQGRDFGLFQLRSILANIYDQAEKAGSRAAEETVETIGRRFLDYIATTEPGFNDYTGNLANSYAAKIFVKGKYLKTLFHDAGYIGKIYTTHGRRGGRYALLRTPPRHKISSRKKMAVYVDPAGRHTREVEQFEASERPKRYLKHWEKRRYRNWNRNYDKGLVFRDKKGRFITQAWIEIENQAPYAAMVQQNKNLPHSRYNVLRGARVEKLRNEATMLVKRVTIANLRKAGFNVK